MAGPSSASRPAVERTTPPLVFVKIVNPVLRRLLSSPLHGVVSRHLTLLHLTGRKTGRRFDIPVAYHDVDGVTTVFTNSRWRANLRGGADVEFHFRGRRRRAHAVLVEDPDTVARVYASVIDRLGWEPAQRQLGITIHARRPPTLDELRAATRTSGLSIIRIDWR